MPKKLEILESLTSINISGTPLADELGNGIKKEFILLFPQLYLVTVNKDAITKEDHQEAEELKNERIAEEEEKRKLAEAEGEDGDKGGDD